MSIDPRLPPRAVPLPPALPTIDIRRVPTRRRRSSGAGIGIGAVIIVGGAIAFGAIGAWYAGRGKIGSPIHSNPMDLVLVGMIGGILAGWLFVGAIGAAIGRRRIGQGAGLVLGLVMGPIGWLLAFLIDGRPDCPSCGNPLNPGSLLCAACRQPTSRARLGLPAPHRTDRWVAGFAAGLLVLSWAAVGVGTAVVTDDDLVDIELPAAPAMAAARPSSEPTAELVPEPKAHVGVESPVLADIEAARPELLATLTRVIGSEPIVESDGQGCTTWRWASFGDRHLNGATLIVRREPAGDSLELSTRLVKFSQDDFKRIWANLHRELLTGLTGGSRQVAAWFNEAVLDHRERRLAVGSMEIVTTNSAVRGSPPPYLLWTTVRPAR